MFSGFCGFQTDGIPSQYSPVIKDASSVFVIPWTLKIFAGDT